VTSHASTDTVTRVQPGIRPGRSCASADMQIPPIVELEEAAKKLVWAAKKDATLKFVHKISSHDSINDPFSLVNLPRV
jgi:hypothetical protein